MLKTAQGVAFYEVNELAKDVDHRLFCKPEVLYDLVSEMDGTMHDDVRAVILASVTGEGLNLGLLPIGQCGRDKEQAR